MSLGRMIALPGGRLMYRIHEVTSTDAVERLCADWVRLWHRIPAAGPFQHPDWLLPWWRELGGGDLWTLAVRDGSDLVALAPFYVYADGAVRQVTVIGNGVTDRQDMLVAPDHPRAASMILRHLECRPDIWTRCDFRDLPVSSALAAWDGGNGLESRLEPEAPCPVLPLLSAAPDLDGTAPAKMLCNLRNRRRRAEECGTVAVQTADARSLDAMLDLLLRLHGARWGSRGEAGMLAGLEAFHREVAARFLAQGWLRLFALRIGDRAAATNYGFHVRDRAYSYIGGLDPDLSWLSPGGLVVQHAIMQAVRDGATSFDFLRGPERYKYYWGARDVPQVRRQVWR